VARDVILNKSKNTFSFENIFVIFLFLENRKQEVKSNIISNSNLLKIKIIFKK